jgi:hypothetical protein
VPRNVIGSAQSFGGTKPKSRFHSQCLPNKILSFIVRRYEALFQVAHKFLAGLRVSCISITLYWHSIFYNFLSQIQIWPSSMTMNSQKTTWERGRRVPCTTCKPKGLPNHIFLPQGWFIHPWYLGWSDRTTIMAKWVV